jgi:hypothetical protein
MKASCLSFEEVECAVFVPTVVLAGASVAPPIRRALFRIFFIDHNPHIVSNVSVKSSLMSE